MDDKNNLFGPASLEMQDSYLHLDKYLAELISHAEYKYGKAQCAVFSDCQYNSILPGGLSERKIQPPGKLLLSGKCTCAAHFLFECNLWRRKIY